MSIPVTPKLVVDLVIFDNMNRLLLIKRKNSPFKDKYCLPGGFVDVGETIAEAAVRELKEETSLWIKGGDIKLTGYYDDPARDPRGHNVSFAWSGVFEHTGHIKARDDAERVWWEPDWHTFGPEEFGFDHYKIIRDAFEALCLNRDISGEYGAVDDSTLMPTPVRLTPAQRRDLLDLYNGINYHWRDTFTGLIKRGMVENNLVGNEVRFRITKKGIEAIS